MQMVLTSECHVPRLRGHVAAPDRTGCHRPAGRVNGFGVLLIGTSRHAGGKRGHGTHADRPDVRVPCSALAWTCSRTGFHRVWACG
jgi:hypothetical protein